MTIHSPAYKVVVMGVAGCGKSTLAQGLAQALGGLLIEGDEHHLPLSQAKMRQGQPLTDADREPWLDRLAALLAAHPGHAVLSCSALKRQYRERLRAQVPGLRFVFIDIAPAEALRRVASRQGHEFPPSLVTSQFEALESPGSETGVLNVAATQAHADQLDAVTRWLP